jgi:peptide/nickel transport system ATP-binding protein
MPRIDEARLERLIPIRGTPPSLINVPSGCPFHPRCRYASLTDGRSLTEVPALREVEPGHLVACHLTADQRRASRAEQLLGEIDEPSIPTTQGDV